MKSGYAHDEDASTIARQISSRVLQLKRAREQRRQADASRLANAQSAVVQGTDNSVQAQNVVPVSITVEHHTVNLGIGSSGKMIFKLCAQYLVVSPRDLKDFLFVYFEYQSALIAY